tara:strand:+ start:128 stop:265 length:138 start_codon:yes stop_codon:yes gene_type:complete
MSSSPPKFHLLGIRRERPRPSDFFGVSADDERFRPGNNALMRFVL